MTSKNKVSYPDNIILIKPIVQQGAINEKNLVESYNRHINNYRAGYGWSCVLASKYLVVYGLPLIIEE
jgi:hypothetical protein